MTGGPTFSEMGVVDAARPRLLQLPVRLAVRARAVGERLPDLHPDNPGPAHGYDEGANLLVFLGYRPGVRARGPFGLRERGEWAAVDAFRAAALQAGGRDNGAPGPRPEYHGGYFGAYVFDLDGNNVEAVHHAVPSR